MRPRPPTLTENDVTDPRFQTGRRRFVQELAVLFGAAWSGRSAFADCASAPTGLGVEGENPNTLSEIGRYNNYYEFSTNKEAVHVLARELVLRPWTVTVEGLVENPFTLDLDDLQGLWSAEERIYRLRCVEGWSMVIPWQGFPLCRLLERARPLASARYVEFVSLHRPKEMIGQRQAVLDWPYREGLRLDEAMHPLTLAATGLYGAPLPPQNGAPLRIVVPWKYGFKSAKAITHIRLVAESPATSWNRKAPSEYGFYANVNPAIAHPRWSQRREVRIGELAKRPTLPFNGYAEQVAALYAGMDPARLY